MNLSLHYQISFEEYREVSDATMRQSRGQVRAHKSLIGWVIFLSLAVVFFLMMNKSGVARKPTTPNAPWDMLIPIIPWLLIVGFLWFFVFRALRGQYRKAFDSQPMLHRPRNVQISDERILFEDDVSRSEWGWSGFVGYVETKSAFGLLVSKYGVEVIPKRAFASQADIAGFRHLLERNISPQQSAFPVIPRGGS